MKHLVDMTTSCLKVHAKDYVMCSMNQTVVKIAFLQSRVETIRGINSHLL